MMDFQQNVIYYYQNPQKKDPQNPALKIFSMIFTFLFSIVSVCFLPLDIAAVLHSLEQGVTIESLLTLIAALIKLLDIVYFYLTIFGTNALKPLCTILFVGGEIIILIDLVATAIEVYKETRDIVAVLTHPFVLDFFMFLFTCTIVLCYNLSRDDPKEAISYMEAASEEQRFQQVPKVFIKMPSVYEDA